MRLGVMGGTFDPIHNGHMVVADEALFQYRLDTVLLIPSATNPHKLDRKASLPEQRYRMVELAVEGNPRFAVSDVEIKRGGVSYTVDTLRELRGIYGEDAEFFVIVSADEVMLMQSWRQPEEILDQCRLIAATRPGYSLDGLKAALPEFTSRGERSLDRVGVMEIPALSISSTDIRARAAEGRPFRYLVPEAVWGYIMDKELYAQR